MATFVQFSIFSPHRMFRNILAPGLGSFKGENLHAEVGLGRERVRKAGLCFIAVTFCHRFQHNRRRQNTVSNQAHALNQRRRNDRSDSRNRVHVRALHDNRRRRVNDTPDRRETGRRPGGHRWRTGRRSGFGGGGRGRAPTRRRRYRRRAKRILPDGALLGRGGHHRRSATSCRGVAAVSPEKTAVFIKISSSWVSILLLN